MTSSKRRPSYRRGADRVLTWSLHASAALAGSILLLVLAFVLAEALPALRELGPARFLTDAGWFPTDGSFDVRPMLVGTALSSAGAVLLAAPLGILSGIFARFYAGPRLAAVYRRGVELLAGLPSVVFGLWGLVVLVPRIARLGGSGQSLLAASTLLALMILPTVAVATEAALAGVPRPLLEGAAALGLGRWSTARCVALPAARRAIASGLVLATGRALGETMAVLMVAGNVAAVPGSVLEPVRTLTANVALEMGYATSEHRSVLFVSGLLLIVAVALLVGVGAFRRGGVEA